MTRVHIVGAGMAGLAAAVASIKAGRKVVVHEAAGHAGGRCRSFHDSRLERSIDNGNHLMLGANRALFDYLDDIGAPGGLVGQERAALPFVDIRSDERWTLRPNRGRLPWWIMSAARRVPKSRARDYLAALRLAWASPEATVIDCLGNASGRLYERLWKPLTDAVLNTDPHDGAARLLWPVVYATFGRGEAACRAYVARDGLSPNLVDPALAFIARNGGEVRFGRRLRALEREGGRVRSLAFADDNVPLGAGDAAIIAIPPWNIGTVLPDLAVPEGTRAIVNGHYRLDRRVTLPEGSRLLGIIGGTAQWLFARDDVVSVTVSAADRLTQQANEALAEILWADVARALDLGAAPPPPWRIVNEKRATFAQTPAALARRPGPRVGLSNAFLAGDWTDTGLPATIESAVLSGRRAARSALESH
jgi:squalene-associated FAD-dependent desaturase